VPPGVTFREPERRSRWWQDKDGRLSDAKRYDETLVYDTGKLLWDLTDVLESGETVSSATFTANNGLGVASTGNTTVGVYATITKVGSVEIAVTTSDSRIIEREFFWLPTGTPESDY